MIDTYCRSPYQTLLVDPIARHLPRLHPNLVTLLSLLAGLLTLPLLALAHPRLAIGALFLSGYLDTLDGTLARQRGSTSPAGTVFDICSDRLVESAVVIGLFLVEPITRGLPALLMLGSVLLCITLFLVVGIFSENQSEKSFHYSPGLIERFEAFIFFAAMMLLPALFTPLALAFSALVFLTALLQIRQFTQQAGS